MMFCVILAGCARTTAIGVTEACAVWPYTSWHVKDTDKTIEGNKVNNARRAEFCRD